MPLTVEAASAYLARHPVLASKARGAAIRRDEPEAAIWEQAFELADACRACGRALERGDSRAEGLGRKCAAKKRRAERDALAALEADHG